MTAFLESDNQTGTVVNSEQERKQLRRLLKLKITADFVASQLCFGVATSSRLGLERFKIVPNVTHCSAEARCRDLGWIIISSRAQLLTAHEFCPDDI